MADFSTFDEVIPGGVDEPKEYLSGYNDPAGAGKERRYKLEAIRQDVLEKLGIRLPLIDPIGTVVGADHVVGYTGAGGLGLDRIFTVDEIADYIDAKLIAKYPALQGSNAWSTGIVTGGVISIDPGDATFSVASGNGKIVDSHTLAIQPDYKDVPWAAQNNIVSTDLLGRGATLVCLDSDGDVVQFATADAVPFIAVDYIILGTLIHDNTLNAGSGGFTLVVNAPYAAGITSQSVNTLLYETGFKVSFGLKSTGRADLGFDISDGGVFFPYANVRTNAAVPHRIPVTGGTLVPHDVYDQEGNIVSSNVTVIDPDTLNETGSVVTTVGGGGNSSTNRPIFLSPTGKVAILLPQRKDNDLATSYTNVNRDQGEMIVPAVLRDSFVYRSNFTMNKAATVTNDESVCIISNKPTSTF